MTNARAPACTTSGSLASCPAASQKMQRGVLALASVTYASLHGVHRRFIGSQPGGSAASAFGRFGRLERAIDQILEFLAGLEVGHALRRHVHLVAGFRIAALARFPLP